MPYISVIIPTYNRARYVTEAINSVLAQTYTDYEIIVVDDGSTDSSKDILTPYLDSIKYIYQLNKGVSAARNTAIRAAQGEWIAFLDSDDEWLPRKLELQMRDLQRYPEAVLSCTNILFVGPSGTQSTEFFKTCLDVDLHQPEYITEPLSKSYACTSTVLARRKETFTVGLFDEELSIYEDIDLFFRLSTLGGFVVNPSVLVKAFRRVESAEINLSSQALKDKEKNYASLVKIFNKLLNYKLTTRQRALVVSKLSDSWFDLGIIYHNLKDISQARRCFFASFQANPSGKNLMKLLVGLSGTLGINIIEKKRKANKGFRRSEYYSNG